MTARLSLIAARAAALALFAASAAPALAAGQEDVPVSLQDSFRVGTGGVLCTAQYRPGDPTLTGMFDRGYRIVCRDASSPVARLYALRGETERLESYLAEARQRFECRDRELAEIETIGGATVYECRNTAEGVDYRIYTLVRGNTAYVAEGLSGYDSALRLGLATLVSDRTVPGTVEVATTSVSDPAAFARIQAGTLDDDAARAEAYFRNNFGAYAESAEFFETLAGRERQDSVRTAEFVANQALQQSNLGDFVAAAALFNRAQRLVAQSDGVTQRMIRNFRAIDQLNQGRAGAALAALDAAVAPASEGLEIGDVQSGLVTQALADRINREDSGLKRLGGVDNQLTAAERAQILDGQAQLLRGMALRLQGRPDAALAALDAGMAQIERVRDGRVSSTAWLRSDVETQRALIAESRGDYDTAAARFASALEILQRDYPESPTMLGAKARYAAYLARRGQSDASIALYDELVREADGISGAKVAMKNVLAPYFRELAGRADGDAGIASRMFAASQLIQRPGVAQTQAVLAREMSEGNDEAAALFRLAVTRSREISRTMSEIADLAALPTPTDEEQRQLADARDALATLQREQTALQSRLGEYPRYRVLSPTTVTLEEMQALLKPGEGYYKLSVVGDDVYAQLVTPDRVVSRRIAIGREQLEGEVEALRDSIVTIEDGRPVNPPFDLARARQLYLALFDGMEEALGATTHLVYEPDGAMLQLPPTLLVTEQAGVDAYAERTKDIDADPYDFTGVEWLGRDREVSIAVSPRSFADVRAIAPSRAKRAYLGLGENEFPPARVIDAAASGARDDCAWPIGTWENPISPVELYIAQSVFGDADSLVLTGDAFTDRALLQEDDLTDFRILHFATHGLVTAPRPECPARPALLTSFAGADSDGLLSFSEIFDLRLDADLVVLSACDTAGLATKGASREAGIETGGDYALDGLVRAFVGAGARSVIASHWPVPDDFHATERLISALYEAEPGEATAGSLQRAQRELMDDPLTSHPYYWAAFIILGDGAKPLIR